MYIQPEKTVKQRSFSLKEQAEECLLRFERAKAFAAGNSDYIYISGTTVIKGQGTISLTDVEQQTRVYIKNEADVPAVKEICNNHYGEVPCL